VRELLRQSETRGDFIIEADLEDVGRPASQALLYRAARELLANINKHAGATEVTVRLYHAGDRIVLTVTDDGAGFEPSIVEQRVAEGTSAWRRFRRGSTRWAVRWPSNRRSVRGRW